jgi:hypothetical protein
LRREFGFSAEEWRDLRRDVRVWRCPDGKPHVWTKVEDNTFRNRWRRFPERDYSEPLWSFPPAPDKNPASIIDLKYTAQMKEAAIRSKHDVLFKGIAERQCRGFAPPGSQDEEWCRSTIEIGLGVARDNTAAFCEVQGVSKSSPLWGECIDREIVLAARELAFATCRDDVAISEIRQPAEWAACVTRFSVDIPAELGRAGLPPIR